MDYHSELTLLKNLPLFFGAITSAGTTVLIISICVLFLLSFFIAGSEVAFFSLSNKDINILKTKKLPSYRRIVVLLEHPKILLASMLIANSFVNIGIILISNLLLHEWLSYYELPFWIDFLIKVISVTLLIVIFAEILPKVWATHHNIWFASNASLIIEILNSLFYRVSKRLVKLSDGIEEKVSYSGSSKLDDSNLDYAIDLLPEHEATPEEKQILKGIRKFGGTSVKQIMRTRMDVSGIEARLGFSDLIKLTEELHYSRLPVYKSNLDEIIGVLHTKDLLPYLDKVDEFEWQSLIRPPYFIHEQKLIKDLLQEFRSKRIHFAFVVDEFGGTSGIVTMEDIIEEITGEIKDEFDEEDIINKKIDDFNYVFEGKTMINDFCKIIGIPTDKFESIRGDSDSLAGLLLEIAGEFPALNEAFHHEEFTFIPLQINKNRIDTIKVVIQPKTLNQ